MKPVAGTTAILGKVLAFPLAERPAIIRDSAGWIAVVTLFMSICMWAAVLLRDPKPFVPAVPPVELMHTAPKEGESHGEKNAEHGEKKAEHGAKKEEGHGAKKAESHGEAKKEGHGGEAKAEGHGSGGPPASPFAKREPLIQRGGAKPAPKKKEAEGGEGHH